MWSRKPNPSWRTESCRIYPQSIAHVPEDIARVAKAAFPKGNVYMEMRNVVGTIYEDEDFAELLEVREHPAT
jgi:transposase